MDSCLRDNLEEVKVGDKLGRSRTEKGSEKIKMQRMKEMMGMEVIEVDNHMETDTREESTIDKFIF